ncbi:Glycine receptor subunit alpha-3 [Homalodisca vitripennis]|nr:Glycine receptor subunit alpha-3 [Homalodisca vitripennis]
MWCYMNLENFPFDDQVCGVRFASYAYVTSDFVLHWKKDSPIAKSKEVGRVMGFTMSKFLTSTCHSKTSTGEYTCLKAEFLFRRNLEYYVLHTFLPTALLVIVSWASFWIDRQQILARILLVLSTLFAMSSFSTDIDSSVPNVPYVKAMDVWVGTCFIFLLLALLEFAIVSSVGSSEYNADSKAEEGSDHVVQNANSSQDSEAQDRSSSKRAFLQAYKALRVPKDSGRIDSVARILFPAAFFTFVFIYVMVYWICM